MALPPNDFRVSDWIIEGAVDGYIADTNGDIGRSVPRLVLPVLE
jgi:hypothetical protein